MPPVSEVVFGFGLWETCTEPSVADSHPQGLSIGAHQIHGATAAGIIADIHGTTGIHGTSASHQFTGPHSGIAACGVAPRSDLRSHGRGCCLGGAGAGGGRAHR